MRQTFRDCPIAIYIKTPSEKELYYFFFNVILDVEKEQPNNDIGTPLLSGNGRSQSRINPPATPFSDMNFIDGTENR